MQVQMFDCQNLKDCVAHKFILEIFANVLFLNWRSGPAVGIINVLAYLEPFSWV